MHCMGKTTPATFVLEKKLISFDSYYLKKLNILYPIISLIRELFLWFIYFYWSIVDV